MSLLRVRLWTIGYVKDGKLIQLEGADDCPVNFGGLCPKGLGYAQIPNDMMNRTTKPMYRAPGATTWQEISWDEAIERAARALKKLATKIGLTPKRLTANPSKFSAPTQSGLSAARKSTTRNVISLRNDLAISS